MKPIKGFGIRHVCSIPFCGNKNTTIFTRSGDVGFGQKVYICADCAKEMAAYYKAQAKITAKKGGDTDADKGNSKDA